MGRSKVGKQNAHIDRPAIGRRKHRADNPNVVREERFGSVGVELVKCQCGAVVMAKLLSSDLPEGEIRVLRHGRWHSSKHGCDLIGY